MGLSLNFLYVKCQLHLLLSRQEQEREIKEAIGEMRALKQEMDNKVEQFELCQKQLQVIT